MRTDFHVFAAALLLAAATAHAEPALPKAWSVTASIDAPESAYYDPGSRSVFVSNIAGAPDAEDGRGWISKLDTSGKVVSEKWVDGLDAPKGLRAHDGSLWVADIGRVLQIDIASGRVVDRVPISGSRFLNDVAIDEHGAVYVSDILAGRIYRIEDGKVSVAIDDVELLDGPNGILVRDGKLFVASWGVPAADWSTKTPGGVFVIDLATRKKTPITKKPLGHLDGLERRGDGSFVVSDWVTGDVFAVAADGEVTTLVSGIKNAADLGLVPEQGLLIVPATGANAIEAFTLR